MSRPDDEFDDFLARRKPIFGRGSEDPLEPPEELDRIVLRRAREAIQEGHPARVFRGPRWAAPLAVAATLLLAFTVILQVGMPAKKAPVPEVTVQTISQRLDDAPAARIPATNNSVPESVVQPQLQRPKADAPDGAIVVDLGGQQQPARSERSAPGLVSEAEADRYAHAPPAAPAAGVDAGDVAFGPTVVSVAPPPTEAQRAMAKASSGPVFRRDSKSWLAEIDRLRAEGKSSQADAEFAEYKRQHRAYAGGDR